MIDGIPLGIWHCRVCKMRTKFLTFETDPDKRDPNLAECELCGFVFGRKIDQMRVDPTTGLRTTVVEGVLSPETIERGRRRLRDEQTQIRKRLGIPLHAPRALTQELLRRRGGA